MKDSFQWLPAIRWCDLLSVLICLGGCASTPLATAPSDIQAASLGDRTLAFGRIRWIQNGEERKDYKNTLGWNIYPQFLRVEDGEKGGLEVEGDGSFAWLLRRGTYILYQLRWTDAWDGGHQLEPKVGFQVPGSAHAQCLGTVVVHVEATRDLIGKLKVQKAAIAVEDTCASIAQDFSKRYTDPEIKIVNSLMWHAPQVPNNIGGLENKGQAADFLWPVLPSMIRRGR